MIAEPAGSAADTVAPENQIENTAATDAGGHPNQEETRRQSAAATASDDDANAREIASSDRLRAILEEEGLPEEEVAAVTKPKVQPNANKETKTPAGDRTSEGPGDRRVEADPKAPKKGEGEEDEPALTDEEKAAAPWALPRIHKAVAQRNQAREEAQRLREQLQRVEKTQRPVPTAEEPLADVSSPQEMEAAISEYESLLEWAETNPDGLQDVVVGKNADGSPQTRDYSAQEMAAIRARAGRILRQEVPRRVAILREQSLHEQVAKERLPEMFQEGTEANAFYKNALKDLPGLRNLPGMANMIRWAWIGQQADIEAHQKSEDNGERSQVELGNEDREKGKPTVTNPKVAAFLQKHPPMAPGAPEARVPAGNGANRGGGDKGGDEKVTQAKRRVEAGEGEEAEVDFIESLRESQAPRNGAVLV